MLRKTLAYVLLALILFNTIGYYGVFLGWRYNHAAKVRDRLDAGHYRSDETITISIPLSIPYAAGDEAFHRVDGAFEYRGEFYRLVKQRYTGDTLEVICMRDKEQKHMAHTLSQYAQSFGALTGEAPSAKPAIELIKDYIFSTCSLAVDAYGWARTLVAGALVYALVSSYYASIIHPPERG